LAQALQDLVPEAHQACFIGDTVDSLDLRPHMLKVEAELKAQIAAFLQRAKAADEAEKNEPELDVPAEIARRSTARSLRGSCRADC